MTRRSAVTAGSRQCGFQGFIKPSGEKMFWRFGHMQGMIVSYIAAMAPFFAVNLTRWFGTA
jgi:hypothetical protein